MYTFLLTIQYIGILLIMIETVYIIRQRPTKSQALLFTCCAMVIINSVGYLMEMQATNKELALMAVRFIYLGKAFAPLTIFLFTMHYCKIELPKKLINVLLVIHSLILFLVLTCEQNTLFYSRIDFTTEGLFPHLILSHGIIYNLYTVLIATYLSIMVITCIYRYYKTNNPKERRPLLYLLAVSLVMTSGLLLFLSGLTQGYDTTAVAYMLSAVLLFLAIFRENMLDTLDLAKDYVIDNLADGLVILGTSDELLYINELAKILYPELITSDYQVALDDIKQKSKKQSNIFSHDNVYTISCRDIVHNNMLCGKIYLMDNITTSYNYTKRLKKDVEAKTQKILKIQHSVIASFASMVEARDGITGQHIKRTSAYVRILTRALQKEPAYKELLTDSYLNLIVDAAPLHDIGKIAIPDAILTKPGRLTESEFSIIQSHCAIGVQIISETLSGVEDDDYLTTAKEMAHYHHEKWDGSGYPCGLHGDEIPLCARIMAVADVYDALRSKRSYKEAYSKEHALEIILENSAKHFDPVIVKVFHENIDKIEAI